MNTLNTPQLHTSPTELQRLFENYLNDCQYSKNLRPQTLKGYREVFSVFQKLLPEIKEVDDLHPHLMNEFF
ncbi:MAG: hypothetical protein PSN34_02980, partial [Urechidicola sp.]|nr:hypothetical protein [Urechidicola sp.]